MTMHKDMIYGLGGVPLVGDLPYCKGKYYFVDKRTGSDSNTGERPTKAFATIARAITVVNARIGWSNSPWGNDDCIVVFPGNYDENLTSVPYGSRIVGLGEAFDNSGDRGVNVKPSSGKPLDVTSIVNVGFYNICFESQGASDCVEVTEMNSSVFDHCVFEGTAGTATTAKGLDIERKGTNNIINDCIFNNVIQGIYWGYSVGGDQVAATIVKNCHFLTNKTNALYVHANQVCSGSHFGPNNTVTMTDGSSIGVDDNSNTVHIVRNWIYSPNDAIEGGLETSGNYANGSLE